MEFCEESSVNVNAIVSFVCILIFTMNRRLIWRADKPWQTVDYSLRLFQQRIVILLALYAADNQSSASSSSDTLLISSQSTTFR